MPDVSVESTDPFSSLETNIWNDNEKVIKDEERAMSQEEILSHKLLVAIEKQAALDERCADEIHKNEVLEERIRELEGKLLHQEKTRQPLNEFEGVEEKLRQTEAKYQSAESERDRVQSEIEELTSSLFEEANRMVADARKETLVYQRRASQFQKQLADTETLLINAQSQLVELKSVMQNMSDSYEQTIHSPMRPGSSAHDSASVVSVGSSTAALEETLNPPRNSPGHVKSASFESPRTPGNSNYAYPAARRHFEPVQDQRAATSLGLHNPSHVHRVRTLVEDRSSSASPPATPVVVTDSPPPSANSVTPMNPALWTISQSNLSQAMNSSNPSFSEFYALLTYSSKSVQSRTTLNRTSSSSSLKNTVVLPRSVTTPANVKPLSSSPSQSTFLPPASRSLREFAFFKRCVEEDIDPTLRLDHAVGLSWLARRSIYAAIMDASLIINPVPSSLSQAFSPCSLCGDNRESSLRSFEFRSRPDGTSYACCNYCVARLRSVCGFICFLYQVAKGVWDSCSVEKTWTECIHKREAMFYSRAGLAKELGG
ncbi:guanyl-nucleotide exchange factor Sec2 [Schizosaccharomyces cryophilus OY26]|uniref:Guanyl-nucleotide exchange factor Sec2 n=1 Tax=Schizosaccharomyces cryophilus (strain OY26 / ATCC MYA-4695 / CBS 11777 / NBRC 106824 / NRRL Y48691) TaxID=653667 RepID=S9VS90_SCHCR|nr:guanyl-nucleotide exchange factor Sec2 [Schizosaccharomyces cryophilus OY26]EPY50793.1 guanyl-nucleotide exchange factor Sec2 [Schizosaccharomyces cryophilus OY26]